MLIIVFIATVVTVGKIAVQKYYYEPTNVDEDQMKNSTLGATTEMLASTLEAPSNLMRPNPD